MTIYIKRIAARQVSSFKVDVGTLRSMLPGREIKADDITIRADPLLSAPRRRSIPRNAAQKNLKLPNERFEPYREQV